MDTYPANIGNPAGVQVSLRSAYAWPGGYPIYYMCTDNGILCPNCANGENGSRANPVNMGLDSDGHGPDVQWYVIASGINWEDTELYCDHCNKHIESAYS